MAGIKIPITYSLESTQVILNQFNDLVKGAGLEGVAVFSTAIASIRTKLTDIGAEIQKQVSSGVVDLSKINFAPVQQEIQDLAKKTAQFLDEGFEKSTLGLTQKISDINQGIIKDQKDIRDIQQGILDIEKEKTKLKEKFGLKKMTRDPLEAERKLAAAKQQLESSSGSEDLTNKVKLFEELIPLLQEMDKLDARKKEREKIIKDQSEKQLQILKLKEERNKKVNDIKKTIFQANKDIERSEIRIADAAKGKIFDEQELLKVKKLKAELDAKELDFRIKQRATNMPGLETNNASMPLVSGMAVMGISEISQQQKLAEEAKKIFEDTLKTKQDTLNADQKIADIQKKSANIKRSITNLNKDVVLDTEQVEFSAKKSVELEQEALRLKQKITDLQSKHGKHTSLSLKDTFGTDELKEAEKLHAQAKEDLEKIVGLEEKRALLQKELNKQQRKTNNLSETIMQQEASSASSKEQGSKHFEEFDKARDQIGDFKVKHFGEGMGMFNLKELGVTDDLNEVLKLEQQLSVELDNQMQTTGKHNQETVKKHQMVSELRDLLQENSKLGIKEGQEEIFKNDNLEARIAMLQKTAIFENATSGIIKNKAEKNKEILADEEKTLSVKQENLKLVKEEIDSVIKKEQKLGDLVTLLKEEKAENLGLGQIMGLADRGSKSLKIGGRAAADRLVKKEAEILEKQKILEANDLEINRLKEAGNFTNDQELESLRKRAEFLKDLVTFLKEYHAIAEDGNLLGSMSVNTTELNKRIKTFSKENPEKREKSKIEATAVLEESKLKISTSEADILKLKEESAAKQLAIEKEIVDLKQKQNEFDKESADLQQEINNRKKDFKDTFGIDLPTTNVGDAQSSLAGAKTELAGSVGSENPELQKRVEMLTEIVALLEKEAKLKSSSSQIIGERQASITQKEIELQTTKNQLQAATNKLGDEASNVSHKMLQLNDSTNKVNEAGIKIRTKQAKEEDKIIKQQEKKIAQDKEENKGIGAKIASTFSYGLVLSQLRRLLRESLRAVLELDRAMTTTAMITTMNREETYKLLGAYQELARSTGLATSEIANVITQFIRQGRSIAEAMKLAEVAAKSAKVAGISANDAVNFLTSAVNGFGLAASQAEGIADRFAAVAAASASSFQELASAMSKVSPVAKLSGVGIDFMMGILAKGLETTREAPENIGTAFKTIFARMREVTDIGKATEDGMSLNRVEKALESIGVSLRSASGQFRNLEDVLTDVGEKFNTLTTIEQAYIATALAGTRQQTRLVAVLNDFARTKELIQISTDAAGGLAFQHMEYMKGAEGSLANLRTAYEGFIMAFTDTQIVIGGINLLTDTINFLVSAFDGLGSSTEKTIALIVIAALAYGSLSVSMLLNLKFKAIENALITNKVKLDAVQIKKMAVLKAQYATATLLQKKKIVADMAEIAGTKIKTLGFKKLAIAQATHIGLMLVQILLVAALVAGAALLVIGFIALYNAMFPAIQNAEVFAKQIQENNKEMNELGQKEKSVKKLADRFAELNKKAAKTTEEFAEIKNIGQELESLKIGDQTFQITRMSISGEVVFDQAEYDRYVKILNDRRALLLRQNMNTLQIAAVKDLEGTLKNSVLMGVWSDFGYGVGLQFIEGLSSSLDKEMISSIEKRLEEASRKIGASVTPENFLTQQTRFKANIQNFFGENDTLARLFQNKTFADAEEFGNYVKELFEQGEINEGQKKMLEGYRKSLVNPGIEGNKVIMGEYDFSFTVIEGLMPSEEAFTEFVNNTLNTLTGVLTVAQNKINNLTSEGVTRTAEIFTIGADAYIDAVNKIKEEITDPEVLEQTIRFLGETMTDEAILHDLIHNKKIKAEVLATMSLDLSIESIDDIFSKFTDLAQKAFLNKNFFSSSLGETMFNNSKLAFQDILEDLFSNDAKTVTEGFDALNLFFKDLFEKGIITEEDADAFKLQISNAIKTLSMKEVAALIKDQMELSKKLFDLPSQIAKGDFSTFADIAENFGLDTVRAFLDGNTALIEQFFQSQTSNAVNQIDEAIAKIEGLDKTLSASEQREIEGLLEMKKFYELIAVQEQMRNFRLSQAKDLIKEMNDLLSLQEKLTNLGIDGTILDIFSEMADRYETEGIGFLITQVTKDLESLDKYMTEGFFDPDTFGDADTEIRTAMESFDQLITVVTAAYTRQKKEIEERYKSEIDAIKTANSERFAQIDFTNKLVEAEEKIIEARRRLMGMGISGVSKSVFEKTQKDLKKLQEERQRIIEEKMVEEATKELELDMQNELITVQEELTDVLQTLIDRMIELRNVFNLAENPLTGNLTAEEAELVVFTILPGKIDALTVSTDILIASNMGLTGAIVDLTNTIRGSSGIDAGMGGGGGRGDLMIADNIPFAGIGRI